MNLPTTKIPLTQIQTFSNKLYTNAVYNSLQDLLSENNATIYQNNNDLQQAYIFVQKPKIALENGIIHISSNLILNISNYLDLSKSKIKLISNSKDNLDDYLEQFGYNRNFTNGNRLVGLEVENIYSNFLLGFYHKNSINWPITQIEQLAYTEEFDIGLDFNATTDTEILIPTLEKYFSKPEQILPVPIKQLLHK